MHPSLNKVLFFTTLAGASALSGFAQPSSQSPSYQNDFSSTSCFWSEGKAGISVHDSRLYQQDEPAPGEASQGSTVWIRQALPKNFEIHIKACVLSAKADVNNINLFFCYSDPSGVPLEQTKDHRSSGEYTLYHVLQGYIFTYVNEATAATATAPATLNSRYRLRRCPGFQLVNESRAEKSVAGQVHEIVVRKLGGLVSVSVDGIERVKTTDSQPLFGGLFGLRTFNTSLWWSDLQIYEIAEK